MPHMLTLENGSIVELAPLMLDIGAGDPVDFFTLPASSINAYAEEGNTHVFGNRASSDLVRKVREAIRDAAGKDDKDKWNLDTKDITAEAVKAYRESNADKVEALKAEIAASYRDKVLGGEFATGTRSPGMSLETKIAREATERLLAQLYAKVNMVLPVGKGSRTERDRLIDEWLADANAAMREKLDAGSRAFKRHEAAVRAELTPKPNVVRATSLAALMQDAAE